MHLIHRSILARNILNVWMELDKDESHLHKNGSGHVTCQVYRAAVNDLGLAFQSDYASL